VTLSQQLLTKRQIHHPGADRLWAFCPGLSLRFFHLPNQHYDYRADLCHAGLGLNIVVGLAGLLDLGYVAFFAVGAYSYALLNYHFGMGFWTVCPSGRRWRFCSALSWDFPCCGSGGITWPLSPLGFGEIIRLILENWNEFSFGPSGIANIPRPGLFGVEMNLSRRPFTSIS
jgi:ABC-type branched-subunit amino acid transport system permease subunit